MINCMPVASTEPIWMIGIWHGNGLRVKNGSEIAQVTLGLSQTAFATVLVAQQLVQQTL